MNRICRGCGYPFHTERYYEYQCSDCDKQDREDRAVDHSKDKVNFLMQMIFQTALELKNKFNITCYYYSYVERLQINVQPKEMEFEPPYMISTYVYCDQENSERDLNLMLEELKSCLKL